MLVSCKVMGTQWLENLHLDYGTLLYISEIYVWITVLVILSSSFLTDHAMTLLLLMKINLWMCWYCLVRSQSRRKRTHAHCHMCPTKVLVDQPQIRRVDVHQCQWQNQGHEITPDTAWLWVRVQELYKLYQSTIMLMLFYPLQKFKLPASSFFRPVK